MLPWVSAVNRNKAMKNLYLNVDIGAREGIVQIDFVVLDRARSIKFGLIFAIINIKLPTA